MATSLRAQYGDEDDEQSQRPAVVHKHVGRVVLEVAHQEANGQISADGGGDHAHREQDQIAAGDAPGGDSLVDIDKTLQTSAKDDGRRQQEPMPSNPFPAS